MHVSSQIICLLGKTQSLTPATVSRPFAEIGGGRYIVIVGELKPVVVTNQQE